MDEEGEPMLKVPYGQDPYSVIGEYIQDHITAIEDIIAVIEIDDITTNQLFMVDMNEENYFIWNNDWYEGEKDVALIDFFPVSEAINPSAQPEPQWIPCSERLPEEKDAGILKKLGTNKRSDYVIATVEVKGERMAVTACTYDGEWNWNMKYAFPDFKVIAWMPLPEAYKEES